MKHSPNNRRGRSRGAGKRSSPSRNVYESNGPDVKVRGTPQQILDKYLTLARDAQSSGDRVLAESYLQYAEHYFRILNADGANPARQGRNGHGHPGQQGGETSEDSQGASEQDAQVDESVDESDAGEDAPAESAESAESEKKPKRAARAKSKTKPKSRGRKSADEAGATA